MKKIGFVLIAVLFALALAACDAFTPPTAEAEFDYDDLKPGEFFVTAGTGGNRALTNALARAGADFFEVILVSRSGFTADCLLTGTCTESTHTVNGGTVPCGQEIVYRTTFREGRNGRMESPEIGGSYSNTAGTNGNGCYAYLFAGRYDDNTLLGIGVLTHTDEGLGLTANSTATISQNTRAILFTVQALTTNVTSDYVYVDSGSAPVKTDFTSNSTFRPWDATLGVLPNSLISDFAAKIKIDNNPASIFLLPTTIAADPVITNIPYETLTSHAASITAAPSGLTSDLPKVEKRGFIWSDGDYAPVEVTSAVISSMTANPTTPTAVTGVRLLLNITTGTLSGLGRLSIEYPVVMFSAANSNNGDVNDNKPEVWYLRGGLNNAIVDMGPSFNQNRGSMGGAILIGVGNVLAGAGGFIVGSNTPPTP